MGILLKKEIAGFRKNFQTSDQIFILKTIVNKYIQYMGKNSKLLACFIDLKKAFNTVWHEGLFLKLQRAGIDGKVYELIRSMYHISVSRVRCKDLLSEPINITQGFHQGNVLSPLLFNLFINDVGESFCVKAVPTMNNYQVSHLLYADDLVLLSTSEIGLQKNIDNVYKFCKNCGLNIDKSMVFSKTGRISQGVFRLMIGEQELECFNQ